MSMRRGLIVLAAISFSVADIGVSLVIGEMNRHRVRSDSPPAIELSVFHIVAMYAALIAGVWICRLFARRSEWSQRGQRIFAVLFWVLVVRGVLISYKYWSTPITGAHAVATMASMRKARAACEAYIERNGQPPRDVSALGTVADELHDAWGFRLGITVDEKARVCRITARGAPPGYAIEPMEVAY